MNFNPILQPAGSRDPKDSPGAGRRAHCACARHFEDGGAHRETRGASGELVCPVLRIHGSNNGQAYTDNLNIYGYDLAEQFSLRKTSCGGEKTCFKLGSTTLIKDTHSQSKSKHNMYLEMVKMTIFTQR
ncbi:unnamed protein product [Ranitomeya imitator]|uniref:Uncharacterized protein n=1 Tax=Ranitomeya imitator TaxID=111125 RepID=A0ABN9KWM2_9NEOB|nr:unnamed protein product [Ranitomeya imitator]